MGIFTIKEKVIDLRQTREYGKYLVGRGWIVKGVGIKNDKRKKVLVSIRRLPLLPFSVMKCQRFDEALDVQDLKNLKRKYWVIFSIWEPKSEEAKRFCIEQNWKLTKSFYVPSKTLVVDLGRDKERLFMDLSKDVRQELKKKDRLKITKIKLATSIEFKNFWKEWGKSGKGYVPRFRDLGLLKKNFGNRIWILGAKFEGKWVAGTVILLSEEVAYYFFAWTNKTGREVGAQYKLVWKGILLAKKAGLRWWDFEGIDDGRFPKKSWRGFSLFKKKFGGEEVAYPGCYVKWF